MRRHPEWDLDPDFLTVNHGSFGATPKSVVAAQRDWQDRLERQPSRFMSTVYPTAIRDAASTLATFLNAGGHDLVFVDNATAGCNAVLRSLALPADDEILMLSHAYGAVRNAVRYVAEQAGARIVEAVFRSPTRPRMASCAAVAAAITPRTRLAVIDHITSGSAIVLPVQRIVAACHARRRPGPDRRCPRARPGRPRPDRHRRRLVCRQLPQMAVRPKGLRLPPRPADAQAGLHPGTISHGIGKGFLAEFDWTGTTDPSRFLAITAALDFHNASAAPRCDSAT